MRDYLPHEFDLEFGVLVAKSRFEVATPNTETTIDLRVTADTFTTNLDKLLKRGQLWLIGAELQDDGSGVLIVRDAGSTDPRLSTHSLTGGRSHGVFVPVSSQGRLYVYSSTSSNQDAAVQLYFGWRANKPAKGCTCGGKGGCG